ncbi:MULTISPECIES: DUF6479 family protein [unclassified Streptomyces]|uniref:DUF6479 family protein n=1 Tax=Streptomyces sp. NPDC006544 TaxID=3154583 RepID=UPI0033B654D3
MITSAPLAAEGSSSLFLLLAGVVLVVLLIGAFAYGARRRTRGTDPGTNPTGQNPQARAHQDSWQTPDDDPDPHHRS